MEIWIKNKDRLYLTGEGGVGMTALHIFKVTLDSLYLPEIKPIAAQLKQGTPVRDAEAVWNYVRQNVKYVRDPRTQEIIRRADATLKDGIGDCEDMCILITAILFNMGYDKSEIFANIIAQSNEYCHIFPTLKTHLRADNKLVVGFAMDCVPEISQFNEIAVPISKNKVFSLVDMERYVNSNTEPNMNGIRGLAGTQPASDLTKALQTKQSEIIARNKNGVLSENDRKELRKIHTIIRLNGTTEQKFLAQMLPFMEDVTPAGNFVWKDGTEKEVAAFLSLAELEMETGVPITTEDDGDGIDGMEGIGSIISKLKAKVKTIGKPNKPKPANQIPPKAASAPRKVVEKPKDKKKLKDIVKNVATILKKEIKDGVQHPGHALIRFSPATIAIRKGTLMALEINLFHFAMKLYIGYLTEAEAKAKGYDLAEWRKAVEVTKKAENGFFNVGGTRENFKAACKKGYDRAFRKGKINGVDGIGEAVTGSIIVLATTFLGTIGEWLKGANYKKLAEAKDRANMSDADKLAFDQSFEMGPPTEDNMNRALSIFQMESPDSFLTTPQSEGVTTPEEQQVVQQNLANYQGNTQQQQTQNLQPQETNKPQDKPQDKLFGSTTWLPWVMGGAAVLGGLYIFSNNNSK